MLQSGVCIMALWLGLTSGSSAGGAEPDLKVTVGQESPRPGPFLGVGYHAFFPVHARQTTPEIERLLHQRWKELNPSFARVTHQWGWNVEHAARQLAMMKQAGTSVYLTTWDPEAAETPEARDAYAARVADLLKDLVVTRKLDNIRWYCMTNELSLPSGWGAMYKDLPRFEDYHRRIFKALQERRLSVALLATDASPADRWDSIRWAVEHLDEVTGAYGGHHYINKHPPEDATFYGWFHDQVQPMAALAHDKGKPFLIGEFGPKQHQGPRDGFQRWDGCAYFDTPQEPLAALQTTEAVMAAVNGGADAIAYWTFADFPDDYDASKKYANKWGTFRWDGKEFPRRSGYYAIGLLTRNFRGPASVYQTTAPADLRALAIRSRDDGLYRVAVLNRRAEAVRVTVRIEGLDAAATWQARLYNPKDAEAYQREGPLLNPKNLLAVEGSARVTVPAQSLAVLIQSAPKAP